MSTSLLVVDQTINHSSVDHSSATLVQSQDTVSHAQAAATMPINNNNINANKTAKEESSQVSASATAAGTRSVLPIATSKPPSIPGARLSTFLNQLTRFEPQVVLPPNNTPTPAPSTIDTPITSCFPPSLAPLKDVPLSLSAVPNVSSNDQDQVKNENVMQIAKRALSLVHQKTLTTEQADQVMRDTLNYWRSHVNEGFLRYRKSVGDKNGQAALDWNDPFPGSALFADQYGRIYTDLLGGFGIYNLGRRHPTVVQAVNAQLSKQALHSQELLDPLRAYCAHLLVSLMPSDEKRKLSHVFFTNSGTESVEACLKMALLSTGRKHIVAAVNAFHGKTIGALATTSKAAFRAPFIGSLANVSHVPFNDIRALEQIFASSHFTGNHIACLILEPIQGEGGIHVGSAEYLRAARRLCDEYGACLIFDEVQTGMGRTGYWWYCESASVVPDLMAIGKGFGGGVMPIGACVGTIQVWQKYIENPFLHTSTFGGNPLACAAAIAAMNVILQEDLLTAARTKGGQFKRGLNELHHSYGDLVKEVRGEGLMLGIEFTDNDIGVLFSRGLFERQILVSGTLVNAQTIRIEPPLTITSEQIDDALKHMQSVLQDIRAQRKPVAKL